MDNKEIIEFIAGSFRLELLNYFEVCNNKITITLCDKTKVTICAQN